MPKILLLDDDVMHNDLNALIIKTMGYENVSSRTSGRAALVYLDVCKENNDFPDIMLVDLNMSGMDGFSFIRQYEELFRKFSPKSQIIMLTNSIFDDEKNEALQYESVSDFWSKPLNKKKLKEVLETYH
jgi:CheY-like chemotaxis protein